MRAGLARPLGTGALACASIGAQGFGVVVLPGGVAVAWTLMEPHMADSLAGPYGFVTDGDTSTSASLRLDMCDSA
ncbi:hypothetical protein GCM10023339_80020 [Alloalcanivorax gelatiniphagus]